MRGKGDGEVASLLSGDGRTHLLLLLSGGVKSGVLVLGRRGENSSDERSDLRMSDVLRARRRSQLFNRQSIRRAAENCPRESGINYLPLFRSAAAALPALPSRERSDGRRRTRRMADPGFVGAQDPLP